LHGAKGLPSSFHVAEGVTPEDHRDPGPDIVRLSSVVICALDSEIEATTAFARISTVSVALYRPLPGA